MIMSAQFSYIVKVDQFSCDQCCSTFNIGMIHIRVFQVLGPRSGIPGIPFPFKYFEKYPVSLKINWQISPKLHPRTSDSLNEGLPIKMTREKFQTTFFL